MTRIVNCYNEQLKARPVKKSFHLAAFNTFLFLLVAFLGFSYLLGVSDLTVKGFALQELRAQAASLAEEKLAKEEKIDALQSYYVLSARAKSLNMVAISDIEYIQETNHAVAKK